MPRELLVSAGSGNHIRTKLSTNTAGSKINSEAIYSQALSRKIL
jgi:hypothetical protein